MPEKKNWLPEEDEVIRETRNRGQIWDVAAKILGISRFSAIERGRQIGADKIRPEEPPEKLLAPAYRGDKNRRPIPPGDPASWGAITAGTVLEGVTYSEIFRPAV